METEFSIARRARDSIELHLFVAPLLFIACTGCALNRSAWYPAAAAPSYSFLIDSPEYLAAAEAEYAAGAAAEVTGNPNCIDHYYAAAVQAWPYHVATAAVSDDRTNELYRSSVQCFIASAQRF